jgi:hypothetical protein
MLGSANDLVTTARRNCDISISNELLFNFSGRQEGKIPKNSVDKFDISITSNFYGEKNFSRFELTDVKSSEQIPNGQNETSDFPFYGGKGT